jgi:DNA-binding CsgD family transcriptional regulator
MRDVDETRLAGTLDAIYDAAIRPSRWTGVIEQLGTLFNSHFVDIFARTDDWSDMRGRAIGLDRSDYEDQFLGFWCNRNIWSRTRPVRVSGEVLPTWQFVDREDLHRSAIYNEYLHRRGLDEGLRIALWAGHGWILDISLLRSASVGAFDRAEVELGKYVLPHLQRAASVSQTLQGSLNFASFDTHGRPAFLLDGAGRVLQLNKAADALLGRTTVLKLRHGQLTAGSDAAATGLSAAIAAASRIGRPDAAHLEMVGGLGPGSLQLSILPLREGDDWELPGPTCVLALVTDQAPSAPEALIARFALTPAEAEFSIKLAAGKSLAEIASASNRSINTVRTHLARVMAKTRTQRQSQLVPLLIEASRTRQLVGWAAPHS